MAQKVTTAKFIASSERYAQVAVGKANVDKNRYLTKAEATKLPADLKDNFANFRARATGNGVVDAKAFAARYGEYVSATVAKADKNGDGVLTRTEARALPEDLQDNFANFWNAGATDAPAAKSLQTDKQREDAIYNRQLPASSALGKLAKQVDQQLADGNIMSGVVGLASGKLADPSAAEGDLEAWGKALMSDYLSITQDGAKPRSVKVEELAPKAALQRAGLILAEGNAFDTSNPDNIKSLIDGDGAKSDPDRIIGIGELTEKLGAPVKSFVVSGKVADDNGYPGLNDVGMAIFLNTKSGEFVAYYGREGHV